MDEQRAGEAQIAYAYYPSGRVKSVADPSGRTRNFTWQAGGQLLSESYGAGTEAEETSYTYDSGGYLASMSRGGSTTMARSASCAA